MSRISTAARSGRCCSRALLVKIKAWISKTMFAAFLKESRPRNRPCQVLMSLPLSLRKLIGGRPELVAAIRIKPLLNARSAVE